MHTRKQKRRQKGAGFFNRLKSAFTRKNKPVQEPGFFSRLFTRKKQIAPEPPGIIGRPVSPSWTRHLNKQQRNVKRQSPVYKAPAVINTSNNETYEEATNRVYSFLWQKMKGVPYNPKKVLDPEEKEELIVRILDYMYRDGKFQYPEDYEDFSQALFYQNLDELNDELANVEKNPIRQGAVPFRPFTRLERVLPSLLKTPDEVRYNKNQIEYQCTGFHELSDEVDTLNSDVCVGVLRSIPSLYKYLSNSMYSSMMYLVLFPNYTPTTLERYKQKTYNTNANTAKFVGIPAKKLTATSFVRQAFMNGGMQLVHPRLGFLIQKELPQLWTKHYHLLNQSDPIDRITILTLQKYAAIRRYMWTKDIHLSSEVYRVNPLSISNELLAPYVTLPETRNMNSEIPTVGRFDSAAFFKEFRENQIWAGGRVKYNSYGDPQLRNLLRQSGPLNRKSVFPWMTEEQWKNANAIPIPPLREEEYVRKEMSERTGRMSRLRTMTPKKYRLGNLLRKIVYEKRSIPKRDALTLLNLASAANKLPASEYATEEQIDRLEDEYNINLRT